jgi:hypothetical protein
MRQASEHKVDRSRSAGVWDTEKGTGEFRAYQVVEERLTSHCSGQGPWGFNDHPNEYPGDKGLPTWPGRSGWLSRKLHRTFLRFVWPLSG